MRPPDDSELGVLEELLPWYLNGTLSKIEEVRVRSALAASPWLRERLDETVEAMELANERPSTATLVAHAAGELDEQEEHAVNGHLDAHPADAELVEAARTALGEAPRRGRPEEDDLSTAPVPSRPLRNPWRLAAVAASLLAILSTWAWLNSPQPRSDPRQVAVAELMPDDFRLRTGRALEPTRVFAAPRGATLVLVLDGKSTADELVASLRDARDREIGRVDALTPDRGMVALHVPAELSGLHHVVLLGRAGDDTLEPAEPVELARYGVRLVTEAEPP